MASSVKYVYGFVGNIPPNYHSCDLRNFFSQFLEVGGFECFHFKHRPEVKKLKQSGEIKGKDSVSGAQSEPSGSSNHDISGKKDEKQSKTLCCFIKLEEKSLEKLIKMYHRKHWLDKNGDSVPALCMISKIRITDESDTGNKYKTRGEQKQIPSDRVTFTQVDLLALQELHPPDVMPKGNVGTPTKVFLELIRRCKLPPNIIKRLGLSFPKTRIHKKYGCVPFDYGNDLYYPSDDEEEEEVVISGAGIEIESEGDRTVKSKPNNHDNKEDQEKEQSDKEEVDSESDDDGGEEWERHESLNDDPANYERNKERVYEEEMEVTWEKGGSGIVWYTDAQFWREKEGDFDEQTTDDLDIDTSVYYDPNGGDKDARDYVAMRLHQRRREGAEDTDRFSTGIGKFEKHSRGIGRKVMETQGWEEGEGLGGSRKGISDALEGEGQTPWDRRGFGYLGEKVQRTGLNKKRPRKEGSVFIGTAYDNTEDLQARDTLKRRRHPHTMTYITHTNFKKSTEDQNVNSQ